MQIQATAWNCAPLIAALFWPTFASAQTPSISAVVNAASYSDGPVAPGTLVVIFGQNLGPTGLEQLKLSSDGRVAVELAEVRVTFDGAAAPLIYVSARQVSAVVPYATGGRPSTEIRVHTPTGASPPFMKQISPTAPGLFTSNASGTGQGAIVNADGSLNGRSAPAPRGAAASLFLTGVGLTDPAFGDGVLAEGIARVLLPVSVSVGGLEASVLYAGAAPGTVSGFAQVNILIPSALPYGGDLPVTLRVGDRTTQAGVTIAVEGAAAPSAAPPAPTLTGTALSASSIRLAWTSQAAGVTGFELERRALPNGSFIRVASPSAQARAYDDTGLFAASRYAYRMRALTTSGASPYSNPVEASTMMAAPASPSELRAWPISTTEVELTWRNNSPDVNAVRVESRIAGSNLFVDIGQAAGLTSTRIINNAPGTTYTFRVRAQNAAGYSGYSNETTVATHQQLTIYLIHGIRQDKSDMRALTGSLTGPLGVDQAYFAIDAGFDFSRCTKNVRCDSSCTIASGAEELARHITRTHKSGDIILVGYSLGGLIARHLLRYNPLGVLNGRRVATLVTLGTPHLGYPYLSGDEAFVCRTLLLEMSGNWRSQQASNSVELSPYLWTLSSHWPSADFPGNRAVWFAASGRFCSQPIRHNTGCRDSNPFSDGVVCHDSAVYNISTWAGSEPNLYWEDPDRRYAHSTGLGGLFAPLCANLSINVHSLSDPPVTGTLFHDLRILINAHRPQ